MKKTCFPKINNSPGIENFFALLVVLIFLFITAGPFTGRAYSAQESPCLACHADIKKPTKSVHAALGMGCETCHKVAEGKSHPDQKNSIVLIQNVPGLCYNCHDQAKFTKGKSGHTSVGMCMGCHNPHASDYDKLLKAPQPELCYTCHEKSKFNKKYVHSIIAAGGCTACHTPHISPNRALLPNKDINELCVTCHVNKSSPVKGSTR
jgi:predicted CXXCH cytochrome family protein